MVKATRTEKQHEAMVATWVCSDCKEEFAMYLGYPSYCPACGAEFDETDDGTPTEADHDSPKAQ